jgi:cell division septum initiation protein DivIVA
VASYREREKALNEALVTAQQLRSDAQAQADKEVELMRREARSKAERIVEEGQRSYRELAREIETLHARKLQFLRAFRTMLERYLGELKVEEDNAKEEASDRAEAVKPASLEDAAAPAAPKQEDWLSSLAGEGKPEEVD